MRTIARNESFKELRLYKKVSAKNTTEQEQKVDESKQDSEPTRGIETRLSQYEFITELAQAIDSCTKKQKEVILLKSLISTDIEIANILNISAPSVSERLAKARESINNSNPQLLSRWEEISKRKIDELNLSMIYFEKCTQDFFEKLNDFETIGYYMRDVEGIRNYDSIAFFLDKYYKQINNIEQNEEIITTKKTQEKIRKTRIDLLDYYEQKGITEIVRNQINISFKPNIW